VKIRIRVRARVRVRVRIRVRVREDVFEKKNTSQFIIWSED
jgi:hypothetical protein